MNLNKKTTSKLLAIIFVILFINSIFAYNIDYTRFKDNTPSNSCKTNLYFKDNSDIDSSDVISGNKDAGCYSVKLPKESVEKIWKKILVEGFKIGVVSSDQKANTDRETLDKNQLLITNQATKSGDTVVKKEMPSKLMNPLETPTLLGQACYGPFSYSINLKQTLRIGRCMDPEYPCYLSGDGLFRQNGNHGFWREGKAVTKDIVDMIGINKLKRAAGEAINPDKNYINDIDLGMFSEMSQEELTYFKNNNFSDENKTINIEKMKILKDKAISNSFKTDSFSGSMETTCSGDNCYINVYTLFDKMFNQYFSADLVISSASPVILGGAPIIFKGLGAKRGLENASKNLVNKKIIKKGGFLDNILSNSDHPFRSASRYFKAKSANRKIDNFVDHLNKNSEHILQLSNKYNIENEMDEYLKAAAGKPEDARNFIKKVFKKGADSEFSKLSKEQKRSIMENVIRNSDDFKIASMALNENINEKIAKTGMSKFKKGMANGSTLDDIFDNKMSLEEYTKLFDNGVEIQKTSKAFEAYTNKNLKWGETEDLTKKIKVLQDRSYTIDDHTKIINVFDSAKQPGLEVKLTDRPKDLFDFEKIDDVFKVKASEDIKNINITRKLADGKTQEVNVLLPKKISINANPDQTVKLTKLKSIVEKGDSRFWVKYTDPSSGRTIESLTSKIDLDKIPGGAKNFKLYKFQDIPLTPAEIAKYGVDPVELAADYSDQFSVRRLSNMGGNIDYIRKNLENKGWTTAKGVNWTNQRMSRLAKGEFTKAFSMSYKSYFYNWAYWEVKTAGSNFFGDALSRFSLYMIPKTYTSVNIKHQQTGDVYNDSYIDFFANDGSDQGDLFNQYFNSLLFWLTKSIKVGAEATPWSVTQTFSDWAKKATENMIKRSSTDDIVLLTDAESAGCTDSCKIIIGNVDYIENQTKDKSLDVEAIQNNPNINNQHSNTDNKNLSIKLFTPSNITLPSYILENTSKKNLEKEGQTLISFSHHTDYDGTISKKSTKNSINLIEDKKNNKTCSAKIKDLELIGIPIGWTTTWTGKDYRLGAMMSLQQNLSYVILSSPLHRAALGAIVGDVLPQMVIMPQIHDCVDDKEGYYTHMFVSKQEPERIKKDPKNKLGDMVIQGSNDIQKSLGALTSGTALKQAASIGAEQVKNLAKNNLKDEPIVQARFVTSGNTNANVTGKLFFFELGKGTECRANSLNNKGVEHLVDKTKDMSLIVDKENGELLLNDKDGTTRIIDENNKDFVRLIGTNLGIPAKIIPHILSYIPVPDTNSTLFNIDVYGNLSVEDIDFLNCLKENYESQTGNTLEGKTLTDYLGPVKSLAVLNSVLKSQYDIVPKGLESKKEIVAEGAIRKIAKGDSAKVIILGNRNTKLYPINNKEETIGKNISIQFERGQLIYSGEKNSYIMWVDKTSETNQESISGLTTSVNNYNNEVTGCEEFSLDFKANAVSNNEEAKRKVTELNNAFKKVGPFQMFDTPTKTFIFYTGSPPECEKRMKIIDKKTGKIITDQKISDITETPNGMIIKTEDGGQHNFEFSAEDGVPKLKYNDDTETLLSAQGKSGSFWYDPNSGNWYTENGHLIPFDPEFKEGIMFSPDKDGKVNGVPGINIMNTMPGGYGGTGKAFNIPLTPESIVPLSLYLLIILMSILFIYNKDSTYKKIEKLNKKL